MALKEILSETRETSWFPESKFRQPHVRAVRKILADKFTEAENLPSIIELKDVAKRLKAAETSGSLSQISRKDWSKAGWCLWLKDYELAETPSFLKAYLRRIWEAKRRSNYKKLIGAYLYDYDPNKLSIQLVGKFLAKGVMDWDWVWAERQDRYSLFSTEGVSMFAKECLDSNTSINRLLEETGLGSNFSDSGFARETYRYALKSIEQTGFTSTPNLLPRILEWSLDDSGLRHPGTERELADVLLLPWQNNSPAKETQQQIEEFLLLHFKDPRIRNAPGSKWIHVSEEAKNVMLRWMVGAALEQFLQVVDQVAMPSQWKYRRAFWTAYYKAGVVDEAWVAFALKGQYAAKRSFGETRGFAKLTGASQDHAVLIMKIGGLTIADWSHNGKCHVWTEANRDAPKLYRSTYSRYSLVDKSSNDGVVHSGAPNGTWQAKVANYVARHTSIRLKMNDYMPQDRR